MKRNGYRSIGDRITGRYDKRNVFSQCVMIKGLEYQLSIIRLNMFIVYYGQNVRFQLDMIKNEYVYIVLWLGC